MSSLLPILSKMITLHRVGPAYLFTGNCPDSLKEQALLFAKRLNCLKEEICNTCNSCKKINQNLHPDLHLIESNHEMIKIERLRKLQKELHLKPYEGKYKIVIVHGAEHLQIAASNSLLKILEEPPSQTVFLLLTPYADRLLATILSRCQTIRIQSKALSLASVDFLNQLLSLPEKPDEIFALAKKISNEDRIFHNCLEIWLGWYRSLLFHKQGLPLLDSYFETKETLAKNIARQYSLSQLFEKMDAILETKKNLQFQMRRDLLAENLLLKLVAY